jgi:hypothetical protein
MQIIFGKQNAENLRDRYTVLDLEIFNINGHEIETYCVIPAEKINLGEMVFLQQNIKLHNDFLEAMKNKDFKLCSDISEHLIGKFGGELDTFYEEILIRLSPQ